MLDNLAVQSTESATITAGKTQCARLWGDPKSPMGNGRPTAKKKQVTAYISHSSYTLLPRLTASSGSYPAWRTTEQRVVYPAHTLGASKSLATFSAIWSNKGDGLCDRGFNCLLLDVCDWIWLFPDQPPVWTFTKSIPPFKCRERSVQYKAQDIVVALG